MRNKRSILSLVLIFSSALALGLTHASNEKRQAPLPHEYAEKPSPLAGHFFERSELIAGEQVYIASPLKVDLRNPPVIVIHSHGSGTRVTADLNSWYMRKLRKLGRDYTSRNFIFAASNQHGMNYGNKESVQDIENLVTYIQANYHSREKIELVGYSMGGLPSLHFAFKYPGKVDKIALLSSTTRVNWWSKQDCLSLKNIAVKMWHGTADNNVPIALGHQLVDFCKPAGIDIEFKAITGADHFAVDVPYNPEVIQFFADTDADIALR